MQGRDDGVSRQVGCVQRQRGRVGPDAYSARMAINDTSQKILDAARALQEQKLAAVQKLVTSRGYIADVREQLAAAERQDATAYQEAVRAGWSEAELKQVGIVPPVRQAPGRPRRRTSEPGNAMLDAGLRREAAASVALDRDQTHVVGDPVGASA